MTVTFRKGSDYVKVNDIKPPVRDREVPHPRINSWRLFCCLTRVTGTDEIGCFLA